MVCQHWGMVSFVQETLWMTQSDLGILVPHWRPGMSPDVTKGTEHPSTLHFEVVGH